MLFYYFPSLDCACTHGLVGVLQVLQRVNFIFKVLLLISVSLFVWARIPSSFLIAKKWPKLTILIKIFFALVNYFNLVFIFILKVWRFLFKEWELRLELVAGLLIFYFCRCKVMLSSYLGNQIIEFLLHSSPQPHFLQTFVDKHIIITQCLTDYLQNFLTLHI